MVEPCFVRRPVLTMPEAIFHISSNSLTTFWFQLPPWYFFSCQEHPTTKYPKGDRAGRDYHVVCHCSLRVITITKYTPSLYIAAQKARWQINADIDLIFGCQNRKIYCVRSLVISEYEISAQNRKINKLNMSQPLSTPSGGGGAGRIACWS